MDPVVISSDNMKDKRPVNLKMRNQQMSEASRSAMIQLTVTIINGHHQRLACRDMDKVNLHGCHAPSRVPLKMQRNMSIDVEIQLKK